MTTQKNKIKVSAIICTYNREGYLEKAIDSLLDQSAARSSYEIVIVDNASTDSTAEISKSYGDKIVYIYEPNQGLSYARNAGFRASRADLVSYLDDDGTACKDWIKSIIEAFAVDKEIAAVGGIIAPLWEKERPRWATKDLYPHFSCQDKGPKPFILKDYDYFYGGNSAYRKEILYECGGFPVKLGRIGKVQLVHEEWPVYNYITKHKLKKYYMPAMLIDHTVMKHRMSIRWMLNRFFWLGTSAVYHDYLHANMRAGEILKKYVKMAPDYFGTFWKKRPLMLMLNVARYVGIIYGLTSYKYKL